MGLKRIMLFVMVVVSTVGCSKGGGITTGTGKQVRLQDLYKESLLASSAYAEGKPSYKPSDSRISITAEKDDSIYDSKTETSLPGLKLTVTGPLKEGLIMEFHNHVPLKWLLEEKQKLSILDNELKAIMACVQKAGSDEAANPLTGKDTCRTSSLTYNGHPGLTYTDQDLAPHMSLWLYDESKVTQ